MTATYPHLLSPLDAGRLHLRNRVVFPAHQTLFSEHGVVSDRQRAYYVERARGGVGAIVVEGGAVHPTAVKFPAYLRFDEPRIGASLRLLSEEVHAAGAAVFVQLAHSGSRMPSWDSRRPLWAPSDVHSANSDEVPHAMTRADLAALVEGFAGAARIAAAAGVDGVEVHAAHEYLLGEFLSPLNNLRDDEYGGSLANRARLLLEVVAAVRTAVGDDLVVGLRMNGSDLVPGGYDLDDAVAVARMAQAGGGLDYLSVSAATSRDNAMIVPPMDVPQGVHAALAATIRAAVSLPVFAVGRIKRPEHAEALLAEGGADAVAVARALIADPEWVNKAAREPEAIRPCVGANDGCFGRLFRTRPISCLVNPAVGLERELGAGTAPPAGTARRVVVIGGGPAGLEAALVAAQRGHRVVLHEAEPELGGALRLASRPEARRELWELVAFQVAALERAGVEVHVGSRIDAPTLRETGVEAVVVATGAQPRPLPLPVAAGARVLTVPEAIALAEAGAAGEQVVVLDDVGHFPAYVPAELLARAGTTVTVVTPRLHAGAGLDDATLVRTLRRLGGLGVRVLTSTIALGVEPDGVRVRHAFEGDERCLPATAVVAAIGGVADDALHRALDGAPFEVRAIGDCVAPRTALEAVREGHLLGRAL